MKPEELYIITKEQLLLLAAIGLQQTFIALQNDIAATFLLYVLLFYV